MNILYADDSPTCIFLVKSFLNEYDIKIDIVENGQSAINKIKNHQYDIIITDIQMPIKSGIDVVNYVKKNNINIPVIALTSFATTEEMKKFKSYGFDDYITKPFKKNILIQSMYNVMEKKI